ncbi:hypothetical protein [Balneatrix alpica]|uniref:Uncharacterized protein n=1 Tax=Balneatrix alpica TaxID=75684 RepID=A0ABV5ZFB9_9GAMM|nr:hypothetical protein [Balneatrix alpica]
MKDSLPLPESKKLTVTYRVEPGSLGPLGKNLIDEFCAFAQNNVESLDADYIIWSIIPRNDKTLPEIQYNLLGKRISHEQADQYLSIFGKSLDEFEDHLDDRLTNLIDEFSEK